MHSTRIMSHLLKAILPWHLCGHCVLKGYNWNSRNLKNHVTRTNSVVQGKFQIFVIIPWVKKTLFKEVENLSHYSYNDYSQLQSSSRVPSHINLLSKLSEILKKYKRHQQAFLKHFIDFFWRHMKVGRLGVGRSMRGGNFLEGTRPIFPTQKHFNNIQLS